MAHISSKMNISLRRELIQRKLQIYPLNFQPFYFNFIEEMFKSSSTTQFKNPYQVSSSYSSLASSLHDTKIPLESKSKKNGVKFEIQTEKENTSKKNITYHNSSHKSIDRFAKIWNDLRYMTQGGDQNSKSALKELETGYNYQKYSQSHGKPATLGSSPKVFQTDNLTFSSKKLIQTERKKLLEEPIKTQRSSKQCKSMNTIPTFDQDEHYETISYKPKNAERKYQKLEAYNDLLKQSQKLIQKYKKIQEEKSKLKSGLKAQVQFNLKSLKMITFLQETETHKYEKEYKKPQILNIASITQHESKNVNPKQYSQSKKYGNYDQHQASTYDYKYESKLYKESSSYSSSKSLNKIVPSLSKPMYTLQELSYSKKGGCLSSSAGSFGLSRSASSKKIQVSGLALSDFELGKCLGSGAFGQVFPAKHKKTGWVFALKKVPKQKVKYMLDQFITQIKIQLYLNHPNIIKLYSFFDDDLHFYILMQYMQGGSLYSYLKKQKTLSLQQTSTKLKQVCQGLQHMHDNQILHRDIKPQNIVMSHNVAKLCDFGWSAICKDRRTTYCGTLDYVSPEIIEGDGYDDSVDVWCVGVLTYELLVGKTPFFNISRKQTMKKIIDCSLEYPANMPEIAVRFVKNILKKNPDQRQSINQLLKHPLLQVSQTSYSLF